MNADQLIESYVSDVVRRLPRRLRGDVAIELRALLREELAGRVAARGVAPEKATPDDAMALLTGFGRPAEVAARYRPTFTIIDSEDSRTFLKATVVGMALIWLLGLVDTFRGRLGSIDDALRGLQEFYFGVGLPSLMWPGLLVVWFGLAPGFAGAGPGPASGSRVRRSATGSTGSAWPRRSPSGPSAPPCWSTR